MADKRKYSDRAEYLKQAVSQRRRKLRQMALDLKGSKCAVYGYNKCSEALEFHHLDKDKKEFNPSYKGLTRSWDKIKQEIEKCILVCANCHREIHNDLTQPLVETLE